MPQTRRQIRKLIRSANMVEINGYQYHIEDYNLATENGVALKLRGDQLTPRDFLMKELLQAEQLDAYTLRMPVSKHHLVFIKFQRLKIDGTG